MMKRNVFKSVAAGLLLLFSTTVCAQTETKNYLLVTDKAGAQTAFKLSENPVITIAENEMTVTAGEKELAVSLADMADYKFVTESELPDIPSNIENAAKENSKPEFSDGKVYLSGLEAGAIIRVYTLDGIQKMIVTASTDGRACVDLTTLNNGVVYILRTPSASYKVLNK